MTISKSNDTRNLSPEPAVAAPHCERLTGSRLLVRNTGFNFFGQAGPLVIAIFTIPILIKGLGIDRFGVLTLAWVLIGYFGLFDLGMGRALTKFVAERIGTGQEEGLPVLVWTSLFIMFVFGMVGTVVMIVLSPWLVRRALNIPMGLHRETLYAFYLIALCIPVVITTAGIRGILEAKQRFGFINAVRIIMGGATYLVPLLVLLFSKSLVPMVAVLTASRLLVLALHLIFCLYVMPVLRLRVAFELAAVKSLLRFGGWITVSNIVSPAMVYLDRFLIAALVSIASVAYYVTPYTAVTNLLVIPTAIAGVLFPAFTASLAQDPKRTRRLFNWGVKYVFLVMFPIVLFIVAFAQKGLDLWLGKEFADHATRILQLLTMGVFFNCLAQIPFNLVQSSGRPDLTAKLHLIELPFYLIAVWWMTRTFGIEGTAIVWSARAIIDALILFIMARRVLPQGSFGFQSTELSAVMGLLILALGMIPKAFIINALFLMSTILLFFYASWLLLLDSTERSIIHTLLKKCFSLFQRVFNA